jgi:hypothetical protein
MAHPEVIPGKSGSGKRLYSQIDVVTVRWMITSFIATNPTSRIMSQNRTSGPE